MCYGEFIKNSTTFDRKGRPPSTQPTPAKSPHDVKMWNKSQFKVHAWSTCRKAGLNESDDEAQDTNEEILDDETQDETDEAVESDLV